MFISCRRIACAQLQRRLRAALVAAAAPRHVRWEGGGWRKNHQEMRIWLANLGKEWGFGWIYSMILLARIQDFSTTGIELETKGDWVGIHRRACGFYNENPDLTSKNNRDFTRRIFKCRDCCASMGLEHQIQHDTAISYHRTAISFYKLYNVGIAINQLPNHYKWVV